jgi:hypothetical protein
MPLFLFRCPNVRIMDLGSKLQARQSFFKMRLQWRNHDEHESL